MTSGNGIGWYAVRTQPQREAVAEETLSRICARVFLPRYRKRVILHGYKREVVRPLFPGYILAAFDLGEKLRAVDYAQGVRGVVRFGAEVPEVPEELVDAIEARMVDGYVVLAPPHFQPGQRVRIITGPFAGYEGVFREHLHDSERVAILLDTLSYGPRVQLDRDWIRAS